MTHSDERCSAIAAGAAIAAAMMLAGVGRGRRTRRRSDVAQGRAGEATIAPPRRGRDGAARGRLRGRGAVGLLPGSAGPHDAGVVRLRAATVARASGTRRTARRPGRRRSRPRRSTSASPTTSCRRTGGRAGAITVLDGQVRLHYFGLDVTGFRYDLSHRYNHPLLRITTFVKEPARHDLYLNVGPLHRGAALRDAAARDRGRAIADASPTCKRRWTCGSRRICGRTCACAPGPESRCGLARGRRRRATSGSFRRRRWKGTRDGPARDAAAELPVAGRAAALGDLARGAAARQLDRGRRRRIRGDRHRDQRPAGVAALRGERVPAR